jgi:hypothetical protein
MVSVGAAKAEPLKANKAMNTLRRDTGQRLAATTGESGIENDIESDIE